MGGSTIFQFAESRIELFEDSDLMSDYDLSDGFVPAVAEYIHDECDRKDSFEFLLSSLTHTFAEQRKNGGNYIIEHKMIKRKFITAYYSDDTEDETELPEAYIIFHKGFKEYYFNNRFENVKKTVENMTLDNFMDDTYVFALQNMIDDEFGYYVFNEGRGYNSLDDWIRDNIKNDEESKYWLGSVFNYHI